MFSIQGGAPQPPRRFAWAATLSTVLLLGVQFLERGPVEALRLAGAGLLLLSAPLIFLPFWLLRRYGEGGDSYLETRAVASRGLYALVRHPQYLGYMLLAGGFALLSQQVLALVLAGLSITFFYLQAVEEEAYCLARFGAAYGRYLARVPRFNLVLGVLRLAREKISRS